jgi:hypothetical protein
MAVPNPGGRHRAGSLRRFHDPALRPRPTCFCIGGPSLSRATPDRLALCHLRVVATVAICPASRRRFLVPRGVLPLHRLPDSQRRGTHLTGMRVVPPSRGHRLGDLEAASAIPIRRNSIRVLDPRDERLVLAALAEERADALLRDKPFDDPVFGGRRLKVAGALQREAEREADLRGRLAPINEFPFPIYRWRLIRRDSILLLDRRLLLPAVRHKLCYAGGCRILGGSVQGRSGQELNAAVVDPDADAQARERPTLVRLFEESRALVQGSSETQSCIAALGRCARHKVRRPIFSLRRS